MADQPDDDDDFEDEEYEEVDFGEIEFELQPTPSTACHGCRFQSSIIEYTNVYGRVRYSTVPHLGNGKIARPVMAVQKGLDKKMIGTTAHVTDPCPTCGGTGWLSGNVPPM
jgi:hypothetical protein